MSGWISRPPSTIQPFCLASSGEPGKRRVSLWGNTDKRRARDGHLGTWTVPLNIGVEARRRRGGDHAAELIADGARGRAPRMDVRFLQHKGHTNGESET